MKAALQLDRARDEFAHGKLATSLRTAWGAVNQAMLDGDEGVVKSAGELALVLRDTSEGNVRDNADTLARCCRAVLDGVGGGVAAPGVLDRLFGRVGRDGREKRMRCPECAEDVHVDAKVCRHCGYRIVGTTDG